MDLRTKVMHEYDKLTPEEKTVPFSNGTEFMSWHEGNCGSCRKYNPDDKPGRPKCKIELALGLGTITGDIDTKLAERAGLLEYPRPRCKEWESKDQKPEQKERRTDAKPLPGQIKLFEL